MSEKYKFTNPEGLYYVTMTIVHWIDLFTRKELKHLIVRSLQNCQKEKGLNVHAWCLMPSHLPLIISSDSGNLASTVRDFKKYTSKEIVKTISKINESRAEWLLSSSVKAGAKP